MTRRSFAGHEGRAVELDLCFHCRGLWFDQNENLRLSPEGVVALFRELHTHRHDDQGALARALNCPHCRRGLAEGSDIVRSGRYVTWRCPQRHGRFATFASFMIEKGFVRQLTPAEITDLAARVRVIHCGSCGAPVDLRESDACPYCHAALSLLDPQAVQQALDHYGARAQRLAEGPRAPDLAEALITLERDRERARREAQQERWQAGRNPAVDDLWAAGVDLVWTWLSRR